MCGIAGYIVTENNSPDPKVLHSLAKRLLLGIEWRGRDATGYAFISEKDKGMFLAKSPVTATDFVTIPGHLLSRRKIKAMPKVLLLHTRHATQGKPSNNKNNHPLYSKATGLCFIHNGWLVNDEELTEKHKLLLDAEVDSEVYLKLIENAYLVDKNKNVSASIRLATKEVSGSLACALIKTGRPHDLWLWRDDNVLALAKTGFGYVFASTKEALLGALLRARRSDQIGEIELLQLPTQTLVHIWEKGFKITSDITSASDDAMLEHTSYYGYGNKSYSHAKKIHRKNHSVLTKPQEIWDWPGYDY